MTRLKDPTSQKDNWISSSADIPPSSMLRSCVKEHWAEETKKKEEGEAPM